MKKELVKDLINKKPDPAIKKAVEELESKTETSEESPVRHTPRVQVDYTSFVDPTEVEGKDPNKVYRFVKKDNVELKRRLGYEVVEKTKELRNDHSSMSSAVEWNENVLMAADRDLVEERRQAKRDYANELVGKQVTSAIEQASRISGVRFDKDFAEKISDPEYAEFQARGGKRKYF